MEIKKGYLPVVLQPGRYAETLSEAELLECNGGALPAALWWSIVGIIITNWQDIREGFNDGLAGKPARHKS